MTTLKIQATLLRDTVRPVAPLAHIEPLGPVVLNHVHLWTGDGYLYAACTDTTVAGIERTRVPGATPGFETCVDVTDLGRNLDLVAPRDAGYNPTLILEATPGGLVVQSEPYDTAHPSATFHLQALDPGLFPKLVDLFAKTPQGGNVTDIHLRAHVLARFQAAARREPLRFRFHDARTPILVSAADSFLGMVMPAKAAPARGGQPDETEPNLWPELFGGDEQ